MRVSQNENKSRLIILIKCANSEMILIRQIYQMTMILPNHSMDVQSALPLSDIIMPQHKCEHQKKSCKEEAHSEQALKAISKKKLLTFSNIIIFLSLLLIVSALFYFYWPQNDSQSKMPVMINTLIDISKHEGKSISHPNDNSASGKASTAHTSHSKNDRPSKRTAPISKGQGSAAAKTIIGSVQPPSDDGSDEEDDPNRKKQKSLNDDNFNSDLEDSSSEDSEDYNLFLQDDDDELYNWQLPAQSQKIPLVEKSRP